MPKVILVIHNVRSAHNVGSLLRTADGFGVDKVIISGYSPYPKASGDSRLPHLAEKSHQRIAKTALGAEDSISWEHIEDVGPTLSELKDQGFVVAALEQTPNAIELNEFRTPEKTTLLVGNEISGLDNKVLDAANIHLQIPMLGAKESLNVSVAGAIALYHLKFR